MCQIRVWSPTHHTVPWSLLRVLLECRARTKSWKLADVVPKLVNQSINKCIQISSYFTHNTFVKYSVSHLKSYASNINCHLKINVSTILVDSKKFSMNIQIYFITQNKNNWMTTTNYFFMYNIPFYDLWRNFSIKRF